ncbi:MAG: ribonuclease III [Patescibacteria group bacterium]|nr:ribonuclease III [Patescibacteria group bacterium]
MNNNFLILEKQLGLTFKNKDLLKNVFIHRSYLNEHKDFSLPSNEKLEFLGDSVLSLISSLYLYQKYPHLKEGDYTEIKAAIVCTESLAKAAKKLELGKYLFLSKGEEKEGGRENYNILADCFEALIAAIFLEFGFETTNQFVLKNLFKKLEYVVKNRLYLPAKSRLQEYTQGKYKIIPEYQVIGEIGPEHKKIFKVAVLINKKKVAFGIGKSKKEAEEQAAKIALEKINNVK